MIIYTDEKTNAKLISTNTKNPATYDFCIIENVNEYFHPAKFSTDILMKTAAKPVPEKTQKDAFEQTHKTRRQKDVLSRATIHSPTENNNYLKSS